MELTKSRAIQQGLCCASCQEDVNVHGCAKCGDMFSEGETIYCKHHSQSDCEHYCIGCEPKGGKLRWEQIVKNQNHMDGMMILI